MTEEKTGNPVSASYTHAQALEILAAGRSAQLKASGVAMIGVFHHPDDVKALID
ncbi:hypothetical protein HGP16_08705 [Rhizobium sp. P40RR-XXII]|uniref:hypothetical protein n=1 Tax=unclassified Rhizobium TaxID=2613769 RepID=UPI0014571527|nr:MULTISPECIES: hypothetical protein [unclassified Rhizobium]NLR84454.1 hypothetical protein [Rhizobium sp. P28RR-XV]NLS16639.1 hypothetical protein [Rhizobium sp. P40RR-XXII]